MAGGRWPNSRSLARSLAETISGSCPTITRASTAGRGFNLEPVCENDADRGAAAVKAVAWLRNSRAPELKPLSVQQAGWRQHRIGVRGRGREDRRGGGAAISKVRNRDA